MQWPEEAKFTYREFKSCAMRSVDLDVHCDKSALKASLPPLTPISVQRTLKGSIQSQGQLSVVITNHLPIAIKTSYLETMPWLLQFYLHSLRTYHEGVSRGTSLVYPS